MKEVVKKFIKKDKWPIIIQTAFIFLNIYLLTYPPKIIGYIVDLLYDMEEKKQTIFMATFFLLGMCVVILMVRTIWKHYETYTCRSFEKIARDQLFDKIMRIKLEKLQRIKNGEIMSYFVKDISEVRAFVYRLMSYGTRILATSLIATYTMATGVDVRLTLAIMCPIIITGFIIVKIKKYVELNFRRSQIYFTELSEFVQESTDSIRTTKAYSCEGEQLKEFIRKNRKVKSSNNATEVHSTLLSTCIKVCFGLCYGISILYGSQLVLAGDITIGDFIAFNGYIQLFWGPVSWLPSLISHYKRAQISYRRLDEVFHMEREKINVLSSGHTEKLTGDIEIKDLSFNYPGYLEQVLEEINISVKSGQTLGIIGTVGSGKTTLMNLLLRLYQVGKGKIFIDGRDINEIPIEVLRDNVCYITQDNFLFSTSIRENINLFRNDYTDKEIIDSTKNAMLYDDILEMEASIDTVIGDRGVDLSGGQKQRVVISRAFLKESSIVILDDTFSALDNRTEAKLLENIKEATKEKTCIIVSNRISDIKMSDQIIVLEAGRIIERGTHTELMEGRGKYYTFYLEQASKTEESILD